MEDTQDSVMIALLPITTDWCKLDLPHMTLVYAGLVQDLKPSDYNAMAKDAASIAMMSNTISLDVVAREQFGNWSTDPASAVDVFRLRFTSQLAAMRNFVEKWNASEFPFNPHVTIGPPGTPVEFPPTRLSFDRIICAWGPDVLTFRLR